METNTIHEFVLTSADGFPLSCAFIQADVDGASGDFPARGSVLVLHGAKEDKTRYYEFGAFLARAGFHVFLMDLRGHGRSTDDRYPLGFMDGWEPLTGDILTLARHAKRQYDLPLFLFAHSFGNVLARCFLQGHDHLLDALVMSSTVRFIPSTLLAVPAARVITRLTGKHGHAPLLMRLGDPGGDGSGYRFCNAAVVTDWSAIRELGRTGGCRARNTSLPILSVTGEADPVTGGSRGLQRSFDLLRRCGWQNITCIVYPGMSHSLIHETKKERVWTDVAGFLSSAAARSLSSL